MAQEENSSWLNSQENEEGAAPENVPDIEDFLCARLQLLYFASSILYLQRLSPAPLHSFFFCFTSLFSAFSFYPPAILSYCRSTPGPTHISHSLHLPAPGSLPVLFSFYNQIFSRHEFLIPVRNFLISCAGLIEKTAVY